jgi:hypothetical protein
MKLCRLMVNTIFDLADLIGAVRGFVRSLNHEGPRW